MFFTAQQSDGTSSLTKELVVRFKRMVSTPGVVLCRNWVERREGRMRWAKGTVEDGEGTVLVEAEAVLVELKEKL